MEWFVGLLVEFFGSVDLLPGVWGGWALFLLGFEGLLLCLLFPCFCFWDKTCYLLDYYMVDCFCLGNCKGRCVAFVWCRWCWGCKLGCCVGY